MSDLSPTSLFSVNGIVAVVTGGGTGNSQISTKVLNKRSYQ